jgi:lipid-A-disaccharide synthase
MSCRIGPPPHVAPRGRGVPSGGHILRSLTRKARILVSCGEPSGDLYGAELLKRLRLSVPDLQVFGLAVTACRRHEPGGSVSGPRWSVPEVVAHIRRLRGVFRRGLAEADRQRPDLAVLVDYPTSTFARPGELKRRGSRRTTSPAALGLARRPHPHCAPDGRADARDLPSKRRSISRRACRFPSWGILLDVVRPEPDPAAFVSRLGLDPGRPSWPCAGSRPWKCAQPAAPRACLSNGSRRARPDVQFVLAAAPGLDPRLFAVHLGPRSVLVVAGQTQAVVGSATLALVASGTATVETAPPRHADGGGLSPGALTHSPRPPFVPQFAMVNLIAERTVTLADPGDFTGTCGGRSPGAAVATGAPPADEGGPRPSVGAGRPRGLGPRPKRCWRSWARVRTATDRPKAL